MEPLLLVAGSRGSVTAVLREVLATETMVAVLSTTLVFVSELEGEFSVVDLLAGKLV